MATVAHPEAVRIDLMKFLRQFRTEMDGRNARVGREGITAEMPEPELAALVDAYDPDWTPAAESVPAWRIMGLLDAQGLTAQIEAAIGSLPEPARSMSLRGMQSADIKRNSAVVLGLQAALGMTDAEVDELFRAASDPVPGLDVAAP